jgi:hypothetical protein
MRYSFALLIAMLAPGAASALVMAPPPGPSRVARADMVVLGRIVAHEDKDIEVMLPGGTDKVTYRIAVLKVNEGLRGAKDAKMLRIAFTPPDPNQPPIIGGGGRVNLDVGRDGLFLLDRQPNQNYCQTPMWFNVVSSDDPSFAKQVKETRAACKLLDNPRAGLASAKANERFLAAALMIYQYRTPPRALPPAEAKQEPIDAEESKLILKALQEANWNAPPKIGQSNAPELFLELGLTPQDGWKLPEEFTPADVARLAQAWLREHGETYRVKRFVAK